MLMIVELFREPIPDRVVNGWETFSLGPLWIRVIATDRLFVLEARILTGGWK